MKIGFYAPLPPAHTGVAEYAESLLGALQKLEEVAVNQDGDINLYHLGNNQIHAAIFQRALERAGVVVLHDAVLQHFYLGLLSEDAYIEEFVYNYGAWNRDLARTLWRRRSASAGDPRYFAYPMLKRIAAASLGVVVHNPAAAQRMIHHAPRTRVCVIPHLFEQPDPPPAYAVERWRSGHGLTGECLFGIFGYLRESKRIASVLRAFETARQSCRCALLLAGEFVSKDLERSLEGLLEDPSIIRRPWTPTDEFWVQAFATDACITLRYPPAGETSGIAVRMMGIGKPVVLTAGAEVAALPAGAFIPIDPGPAEETTLAHTMVWLSRYPEDRREIGRRAAAHIADTHELDAVAQRYRRFLSTCYHA